MRTDRNHIDINKHAFEGQCRHGNQRTRRLSVAPNRSTASVITRNFSLSWSTEKSRTLLAIFTCAPDPARIESRERSCFEGVIDFDFLSASNQSLPNRGKYSIKSDRGSPLSDPPMRRTA